jgi:hypothetical protein
MGVGSMCCGESRKSASAASADFSATGSGVTQGTREVAIGPSPAGTVRQSIEVADPGPVVAHLASYEAGADQMGVPFKETIERARERVDETIRTEGAFRVTCLGGILVCQAAHAQP